MSLQFHRPERQQHSLACADHQNETITNYCSALDCLKPLCPECTQLIVSEGMFQHNMLHKQKHTYPEVESLRGVINNSQKRLKEAGVSFQKEIINIENQIHEPQVYHQESLQQLQKMKKQIQGIVELHFQEMEHKLAQSASEMNKKFMHISPQIEKIKQFQKEIELMYKQLDPHDHQLFPTLQKVALLDVDQFLDKFKAELTKTIQSMNFEQLILRLDDASPRLGQLKVEIEKCVPLISFRHHPYSQTHHNTVLKTQNQKFGQINQSYVETMNSYVGGPQNHGNLSRMQDDTIYNQDSPSHSVQDSFQATEGKMTRKKEMVAKPSQVLNFDQDESSMLYHINQPDYFLKSSQRKFLHFFQNDSINLFYFDLTKVAEFQLIELNNNFVIPSFHRSIATPNGNLYLIGGTLNDGQKSGVTYQFDFNQNSLQAVGMMLYPRSSHGVVYLNGFIYAIGGYEQKHIMTSKCERMSMKGKWETVASLNQVCTSMSVCSFGKYLISLKAREYIYKFGGITANYNGQYISNTIERYDANVNIWKIVEVHYQQQIQHLSTAACLQINQTDVIVFGGYNEDNIGSNQCYLASAQDDRIHVVHSVNVKPLPFSEAFWNAQTVIHEGSLFVLQNVSGESEDSCLEDERLVLGFNGREWKLVE